MKSFILIPLFAAIVNSALAFFVFSRDPKLRTNQIFLLWGLCIASWNFGAFCLFRVTTPEAALVWARITGFAVIFLPPIFLHLTLLITKRSWPRYLTGAYVIAGLFALSDFTPFFIRTTRNAGYAWWSVAGPGFWAYANVYFPAVVFPALIPLGQQIIGTSKDMKRQFATLVVADVLLVVCGTHDLLPVMGFDYYPLPLLSHLRIYPIGLFAASLYGLLVAYAVLHDQILDIRVSLGRQAATLLRLGFLLGIAYLLLITASLILPNSFSLASFVVSMGVLAASAVITSQFFPRLLGGQSERLERRLLGDRFEYEQQVTAFTGTLLSLHKAPLIVKETLAILRDAMKLSFGQMVILDIKTEEIQILETYPKSLTPAQTDNLRGNGPIFEFFQKTKEQYLDCRNTQLTLWTGDVEKRAREALKDINPEFVIRIGSSEHPFGLMVIGRIQRGTPVSPLDMDLLITLCEHVGFALERVRLAEQTEITIKRENMEKTARALAHDLNNLISPIAVYLHMMASQHEPGTDEWEAHRLSQKKLTTFREYVDETLLLGSTKAINPIPLTCGLLLKAVVEVCEDRAKASGVTLHPSLPANDPQFVGDRIHLQRALANLVNNSIDACQPGKAVTLSATELPKSRKGLGWIRFTVADTGSGISPENLNRVFEPYFTTRDTGNRTRGFGLGLAVVQQIVRLHYGTITLKSAVGVGTTIQIDLPLDPEQEAAYSEANA